MFAGTSVYVSREFASEMLNSRSDSFRSVDATNIPVFMYISCITTLLLLKFCFMLFKKSFMIVLVSSKVYLFF